MALHTIPKQALSAALAALLVALAGCTAGTKEGADGLDVDEDPVVLYLNVTVNGQTYRYSTDQVGGGGGDGDGASGTVSGSVTPGANGTVQGNATSGSSTAQGNASAGSGSATATGTYGNASAGAPGAGGAGAGMPGGVPSGPPPLDVRVELGAAGVAEDLPIEWSFAWGDAAGTAGGNGSANATGNPGAAPQQARESGSSLPATLQHTFTQAGRHNLDFGLKVLDGLDAGKAAKGDGHDDEDTKGAGAGSAEDAIRTLSAAVVVEGGLPAGGPEPGSFLGNQTDTFGGSALAATPVLCQTLDTFEWNLNETFGGSASVVQRVTVNATADAMMGEVTLTLLDANGTELASGGSIDERGEFPPGAYTIEVEACPSANIEYTVTAMGQHFAK